MRTKVDGNGRVKVLPSCEDVRGALGFCEADEIPWERRAEFVAHMRRGRRLVNRTGAVFAAVAAVGLIVVFFYVMLHG